VTAGRPRHSLRPSLPLAVPTAAIGLTFGLLAAPMIGTPAAVVMSAPVWSGTAQLRDQIRSPIDHNDRAATRLRVKARNGEA